MLLRRMDLLPALLAPLAALGACAAPSPLPYGSFLAGDLEEVEAHARKGMESDDSSWALHANNLATVKLLRGDREEARRTFLQAGRVMGNWETTGGEAFAAIMVREDLKEYRGDPYEQAMNSFYTGLLYWMRGEFDNARAAARAGILADSDKAPDGYESDFALLYWMSGRMSRHMGLHADAEDDHERARKARQRAVAAGARGASNHPVLEDPDAGNLVLVVDLGMGPRKYPDGPHGTIVRFRPVPRPEAYANVYLDGAFAGRTHLMGDLYYQAITRGGRVMDGIRKGKAVFKEGTGIAGVVLLDQALQGGRRQNTNAIVGGSLLLLSLLVSAEADTRHWALLPDTVQLALLDAPPGIRRLRLEFCDRSGRVLPDLTQEWEVEVPAQGEGVYYFRSLPGLHLPRP